MKNLEQDLRAASQITLDKVSSWEDLNAATLNEADKKFKEKTRETWKDFAVSGVLQFDKNEGKQVLRPFTDLDGRCALGVLKKAGINTSNLAYIKPGEYLKGAINLDTGDKFGVIYEEPTYSAFFDHHEKNTKEVTSTTEIVYKTMVGLGVLQESEAMEKLVNFVTKIDNRQYPPEEFLKSAKTILGLQRDLDFEKLLLYFQDHEDPQKELKPEELAKYGLKESAEIQQKIVDRALETLGKMEQENKSILTKYGNILINVNNELEAGASAAYIKFDGIINFTHGKSFAVTLKNKNFNETDLRNFLGKKFQGKIIREKMWIYNEREPLELSLQEIIGSLVGIKEEYSDQEIKDIEDGKKILGVRGISWKEFHVLISRGIINLHTAPFSVISPNDNLEDTDPAPPNGTIALFDRSRWVSGVKEEKDIFYRHFIAQDVGNLVAEFAIPADKNLFKSQGKYLYHDRYGLDPDKIHIEKEVYPLELRLEQVRGIFGPKRCLTTDDLLNSYDIDKKELLDKNLGWNYIKFCWETRAKDDSRYKKLSFNEFRELYCFILNFYETKR